MCKHNASRRELSPEYSIQLESRWQRFCARMNQAQETEKTEKVKEEETELNDCEFMLSGGKTNYKVLGWHISRET